MLPSFFLHSDFLSLNADFFEGSENLNILWKFVRHIIVSILDEQLYSAQIGGGDWFWVKTTYDSQDDTFSVIGADGALVALDDVIQDNNHLLEKVIVDTGYNRLRVYLS